MTPICSITAQRWKAVEISGIGRRRSLRRGLRYRAEVKQWRRLAARLCDSLLRFFGWDQRSILRHPTQPNPTQPNTLSWPGTHWRSFLEDFGRRNENILFVPVDSSQTTMLQQNIIETLHHYLNRLKQEACFPSITRDVSGVILLVNLYERSEVMRASTSSGSKT